MQLFLHKTGPVLCLDIGEETQKAILARPGKICPNWPAFVLPSQASLVAQRICELTLLKRGIWLHGDNMGGSFRDAARAHIGAGLPLYATEKAAKSLHFNLEIVRRMGIQIAELCPPQCVPLHLCDYNPEFWRAILRHASLPLPHMILAAVQDHGQEEGSAQESRSRHWQKLLLKDPDPVNWIYESAPASMQRLKGLQASTGGPVADTGAAAILGAICDDMFFDRCCREGVTFVNAGNRHILAALVYKGKVFGIYEHHSDKREVKILLEDLDQFRKRWLPDEKVHSTGGLASIFGEAMEEAGDWKPTFILGPKRKMLKECGQFFAPYGNMLFAGCYGLLYGWSHAHAKV